MKFLSFILLAFILITGCKKTTMVSGVITSSATGQPIEGVAVRLLSQRSTGPTSEVLATDNAFTDNNGSYSVEIESKNADLIIWSIAKNGFVEPKIIFIEKGDSKTIDYVLNPYDAWLSVTFKNQSSSLARKFYFNYTGPFFEGEIQGSNAGIGPFLLQPQVTADTHRKLPLRDTRSLG